MKRFELLGIISMLMLCNLSFANSNWMQLSKKSADLNTVENDLRKILIHAKLPKNLISINILNKKIKSHENLALISCSTNGDHIMINIDSDQEEWSSTFYNSLQQLGFYFPHPRLQISPKIEELFDHCGKSFKWKPTFKYRGFHLHTMHPSEWVHGFLMGKEEIALDLVRWLARNNQNVFDVSLLRVPLAKLTKYLSKPSKLAHEFGIQVGYSLSFALTQQKSYKLIPLLSSVTGIHDERYLKKNLSILINALDFDFISLEAGTTEFTSVNYERALKWMELARVQLKESNRKLFMKVHVSSNQNDPKWGNFNFLPQHTHPDVGVLPHTVMFYGLYDEKVPMYGNTNFSEMLKFTLKENSKRSVWYYPETSYWIAMDMDAPLFLTDYLVVRAKDMKELSKQNIEGHFNFTSGHENGYWLFDWTLALNTNAEYQFDPYIGLKLLGENMGCWSKHVEFQNKHFKNKSLISILSFPNLQDELSKKHRIHERNLLKEIKKDFQLLTSELILLEGALAENPSRECIKTPELKMMLEITSLRIKHAHHVRMAILNLKNNHEKVRYLAYAKDVRLEAKNIMSKIMKNHQRYPEAKLYERQKNPTSYSFGYLWTTSNMHFWELEEKRVEKNNYGPFFMNIYNFLKIIF